VTSWLVVGCGYVGAALTQRLRSEGHSVTTTRRQPGADLQLDLSSSASTSTWTATATDVVVCLAPPGRDPAAEMANLARIPCRKLVYLSSTGVYAPAGGAIVDETFPLAPVTASGRARVAAEAALPAGAAILRAAGIYGPGRGLVDRLRAGTYRIVGDGTTCVARIHVEDLVTAIMRAAITDLTGPANAADDAPDPIGTVADTLAAALHLPAPPRVAPASVDPEVAGMLTADRRISNRRLREELGVELRYPSWRSLLPESVWHTDSVE
jgi:nucleoside-diphosphate-sugar epimerase